MNACANPRSELVALLGQEGGGGDRRRLAAHVEACEACAAELRALQGSWQTLPTEPPPPPPADLRTRALAYAREAVEPELAAAAEAGSASPGEPGGVSRELWQAVRPVVLPATGGVLAAAAVVAGLHARGGMAVEDHIPVLMLGLLLAALLSGAFGGLRAAASPRTTRAVLLGGLASLGGYLLLSILHPIPSAVEFCQIRIFRDPAMSLGEICLVYAGVAALYAGVPVGLAAYLSPAGPHRAKLGLAAAVVFTLLALPVLSLQFGMEDVVITATVGAGLAAGAVAGGLAGGGASRLRRSAGARA